jgi:hypothetical protein
MIFIVMFGKLAESYRAKRMEWFSTSLLVMLGAVFLLPVDTFATSRSYDVMHWWAPEKLWGSCYLLAGTIRLMILYINGQWWRTALLRSVAAFLSLFFWITIGAGFLLANPYTWGGYLFVIVTVFEWSNMKFAAHEAGTLEKIAIVRARIPAGTGWRGFARYLKTDWRGFLRYVVGMEDVQNASRR